MNDQDRLFRQVMAKSAHFPADPLLLSFAATRQALYELRVNQIEAASPRPPNVAQAGLT